MRAFIEVHLKLVMTIWIILVSVLGLLYLMNHMKFNSLMSEVVSSQLQVMSTSLERSIIKAEQLGLPLQGMNNLPELLQRTKSRDQQVKDIYVINNQGRVLFSTNAMTLNPAHQSHILRRALKGKDASWTLEEEATLYSGQQLFDGTQNLMGSIIIAYNKSAYGSTLAQVKLHLLEMTLMIFTVFALFIFIAVRLGFSEINNVFKLIRAQLSTDKEDISAPQLAPGTMAYQFAEQIEQSNQMKSKLNHELESLNTICESGKARSAHE